MNTKLDGEIVILHQKLVTPNYDQYINLIIKNFEDVNDLGEKQKRYSLNPDGQFKSYVGLVFQEVH